MKNICFAVLLMASSLTFLQAQNLEVLKEQRQAVKLNLDLIDKKIDLEKAIAERDKREAKAAEANSKAESVANTDATASSDPKEAKKAARIVKQAESATKSLERGNNAITKLEAEIKAIEEKIDNAKYIVEIHGKN